MQFFISFLTGIVFFHSFQYFPFSTIFISLLSSVYLLVKKKFSLILILLSGIVFAFMRYEPVKDILLIRDDVAVRGIFKSLPAKTDSGMFKQTLNIKSALDTKTGEKLKELTGKEIILFSDREFDPGTECDIAIKFLENSIRLNPGEQSKDEFYANLLYIYMIQEIK
jgi:hypothetical protein